MIHPNKMQYIEPREIMKLLNGKSTEFTMDGVVLEFVISFFKKWTL